MICSRRPRPFCCMCTLFPRRIAKDITMAVKAGGTDPATIRCCGGPSKRAVPVTCPKTGSRLRSSAPRDATPPTTHQCCTRAYAPHRVGPGWWKRRPTTQRAPRGGAHNRHQGCGNLAPPQRQLPVPQDGRGSPESRWNRPDDLELYSSTTDSTRLGESAVEKASPSGDPLCLRRFRPAQRRWKRAASRPVADMSMSAPSRASCRRTRLPMSSP